MSRSNAFGLTLAVVVTFSAAFVDWNGPVPEGDPDLVPVGIYATIPPATTVAAVRATGTTTTAAPTTVPATTTTVAVPGDWQCPDAVNVAAAVGWPAEELPSVDAVVWRESRCTPEAYNGQNRDRSYGLTQINTKGDLWPDRRDLCGLQVPTQLWDSATNLTCALRLWERSGWGPWGGRP